MKIWTKQSHLNLVHVGIGLIVVVCCMTQLGCISMTANDIPASRLPLELRGCSHSDLVPINLASLRQEAKEDYTVDAGDVVGVFVPGIVPPDVAQTPVLQTTRSFNDVYYPPGGLVMGPGLGIPLEVTARGLLELPLTSALDVRGMTLPEIQEKVMTKYLQEGMLKDTKTPAQISVIRKRVHRVMVIREDINAPNLYKSRTQTVVSERGTGELVDLPAFENDVLHALSVSGGLPGTDAYNRIWIFRGADETVLQQELLNAAESDNWESLAKQYRATCIPLKIRQGETLPFSPADIILNTGDVVYVEGHKHQWFYTGGFMPGGQFALPRDEDIDVLEAIAMATGQIGSQALTTGLGQLRSPPTSVVIVRKLADGQQFRIRVDMAKATRDANERVLIQPDDLLMVYYKPRERGGNALLDLTSAFFTQVFRQIRL
jgi:protein involved in polysaccharide export with SLBB domain